jgi:glycosyltransferase 2 family protein
MFKKILGWSKILIPLLLFFLLFRNIFADWEQVIENWKNFRLLPLVVAWSIMLFVYPEGGFTWYVLLRQMGQKVKLLDSVRIWLISTTSRYIPGVIWQYIGRVELSSRQLGISKDKTVMSLLAEIFLLILASSLMSLPIISIIRTSNSNLDILLLLAISLLLVFHPTTSRFLLSILARLTKSRYKVEEIKVGNRQLIYTLPFALLNFLINGLALSFVIYSVSGENVGMSEILTYTAFFSLSWLIGFISFFAPAGLGVAEVTLTYLLTLKGHQLAVASLIALSYRFFLTIAELIAFAVAIKYKRRTLNAKQE